MLLTVNYKWLLDIYRCILNHQYICIIKVLHENILYSLYGYIHKWLSLTSLQEKEHLQSGQAIT